MNTSLPYRLRPPVADPLDPNDPMAQHGGGSFNEKAPVVADPVVAPPTGATPPPGIARPTGNGLIGNIAGLGGGAAADAINKLLGMTPGQDGAALWYPNNHTIGLKGSYLVEHPGQDWEEVQRTPERPKTSSLPPLGMGMDDPTQTSDTMAQILAELQAQQTGDPSPLMRQRQLELLKGGR